MIEELPDHTRHHTVWAAGREQNKPSGPLAEVALVTGDCPLNLRHQRQEHVVYREIDRQSRKIRKAQRTVSSQQQQAEVLAHSWHGYSGVVVD
jgi:hypothetical protein